MAVPPEKLAAVAAAVNRFPEVNHNYEREHRYNLWFVVTAASEGRLQASLGAIEQAAGYPLMALPLLEEFHIDLGFCLSGGKKKCVATAQPVQPAHRWTRPSAAWSRCCRKACRCSSGPSR
jgi:DNA-binding Lrp family transcriptional regulator